MTCRVVQRVVAGFYRIPLERLRGRSRHPLVAVPRAVAMYLCRRLLKLSYPQIGRSFERDHTTAIQSYRKITRLLETDQDMVTAIDQIATLLSKEDLRDCCETCGRSFRESHLSTADDIKAEVSDLRDRLNRLANAAEVLQ